MTETDTHQGEASAGTQEDGVYRQSHLGDPRLDDIPDNTHIKAILGVAGGGKSTEGERDMFEVVREGDADPDEVLIVSFTQSETKDRVAEFQERAEDTDDDEVPRGYIDWGEHGDQGATVRTFNSISYMLADSDGFDFDEVVTANDARHIDVFRDFFRQHAPQFEFSHNTKEPMELLEDNGQQETPLGNQFIAAYNYVRGQGYTEYDADLLRSLDLDVDAPADIVAGLMDKWEAYKRDENVVQHDDYVHHVLENGLVPEDYRFLLVDEFQDLSPIQYGVFKLWRDSGQFDQITIMGDPAQTIYSTFRGTNSTYIQETPRHETVTIANSKRCAEKVMETAAPLVNDEYDADIGSTPYRKLDGEWKQVDEKGTVNHHHAHGEDFLPRAMLEGINKYVEGDGGTIMTLGRTNRDVGKVARYCNQNGIPYSSLSDSDADEKSGLWYWKEPMSTILRVLRSYKKGEKLIAQKGSLPAFRAEVANKDETSYRPLSILLANYYGSLGVAEQYAEAARERTMLKQIRRGRLEGDDHLEDLTSRITGARPEFLEFIFDGATVEEIVSDLNLAAEQKEVLLRTLNAGHEATPQDIRIGTIHASKGTQADCVFLLNGYSQSQYDRYTQNPTVKAEEKRLFYVGCTRAKTALNIVHSWNGSKEFPPLQ